MNSSDYFASLAATAAASPLTSSLDSFETSAPKSTFNKVIPTKSVELSTFLQKSRAVHALLSTTQTAQDEVALSLYARAVDNSNIDVWRGSIKQASDTLRDTPRCIKKLQRSLPNLSHCDDFTPVFKDLQSASVQHYLLATRNSMLTACIEGSRLKEAMDYCKAQMNAIVSHMQGTEPESTRRWYFNQMIADITKKSASQLKLATSLHPSLQSLMKESYRETLKFCECALKKFKDQDLLKKEIDSLAQSLAELRHDAPELDDAEIDAINNYLEPSRTIQLDSVYCFNTAQRDSFLSSLFSPTFPELSSRFIPGLEVLARAIVYLKHDVTQRIIDICHGEVEPRYANSNRKEVEFFSNCAKHIKTEIAQLKDDLYKLDISPEIPAGLNYIAKLRFLLSETTEYIQLLTCIVESNFIKLSSQKKKLLDHFAIGLDPNKCVDMSFFYTLVDAIHAYSPMHSSNPFVKQISEETYSIFERIIAKMGRDYLSYSDHDEKILNEILSQKPTTVEPEALKCFVIRSVIRYLFFSHLLPTHHQEFDLALHILRTDPQFTSLWLDQTLQQLHVRFNFNTRVELDKTSLNQIGQLYKSILLLSDNTFTIRDAYHYAKAKKLLQMPTYTLTHRAKGLLKAADERLQEHFAHQPSLNDQEALLYEQLLAALWPNSCDIQEQAITFCDEAIKQVPLDNQDWIQSHMHLITLIREFALMKLMTDQPRTENDNKSLIAYLGRYVCNASNEKELLIDMHSTVHMELAVYKMRDELTAAIAANRPQPLWEQLMEKLASFQRLGTTVYNRNERRELYVAAEGLHLHDEHPCAPIFNDVIKHMYTPS